MKKTVLVLALFAALSTATRAGWAEEEPPPRYEPPSKGTGLIVTGSIFTAIGGVNLLTAPLCKSSAIAPELQTPCLGASLGVGITFAVIGIPLLAVGVSRRNAYLEWKRTGGFAARLTDLDFKPLPGGGALSWHAAF